jgi:hypothetical protein
MAWKGLLNTWKCSFSGTNLTHNIQLTAAFAAKCPDQLFLDFLTQKNHTLRRSF